MHGFDHVRWRGEVETQRVADVERKNLVAVTGELVGENRHVPNGVANLFQALGGGDVVGVRGGHRSNP